MNENRSKYYEACRNEIDPNKDFYVNLLRGCINRMCVCINEEELNSMVCSAIYYLVELRKINNKRLSLLKEYNIKDE